MGYSLSWLAVKGKPPQAVLDELALRPTGQREEIPESGLSAVATPNGWYLIVADHTDRVCPDDVMQRLASSGCELVTCFVEEHVMASRATGWRDGKMIWSITHDVQKGRKHLEVLGEPPPQFAAIRDELSARDKPGECDYLFNIPVETAKSVCGYQHDEDVPGLSGEVFEVLESIIPQKPSLFKRLFGS
jgi:hypothetical protein